MTTIGNSVIKYLGENYGRLSKDASLRGKMIGWGSRFKYGEPFVTGTAYLYIDKVFLALVNGNGTKSPYEGSPEWALLIDLAHMRVTDEDWVLSSQEVPEKLIPVEIDKSGAANVIASAVLKHFINKIYVDVLNKKLNGKHRWRGIFHWGDKYVEGDIVAYNHGVFVATPGYGTPGMKDGWSMLDMVHVGAHKTHKTVFHAATEDGDEFIQELVGAGGETYVHTADIYAADHEGVYRTFGENEQVVEGGRVVENQCPEPNDLSNAGYWAPTGTGVTFLPTGGVDGGEASRLEISHGSWNGVVGASGWATTAAGRTITESVWIKATSTPQTVRLRVGGTEFTPTITIPTYWVRVSGEGVHDSGSMGIYCANDGSDADVVVCKFQLEWTEGRSNINPSEYIPTTSTAVQKTYANANGNSVTDNVVTEAVGALLDPLPMLVYQPAATNMQLWNSDLTSRAVVAGTPVVTLDQTGPVNAEGNAWQVEDNETGAAASIGYRYAGAVTGFTGPVTMIADIVKDAESTVECYWDYQLEGGTLCRSNMSLNTSTGVATSNSSDGGITFEVEDKGDHWRLFVQLDADGTQTHILSRFYPTGTTASNVGSVGVIYDAIFKDKTIPEVRGLGPIFTEGTAVTTDETIITHAAANHDNAEGTYTGTIDYAGDDTPVLSLGGVPFLEIGDGGVGDELVVDSDFDGSCGVEWACAPGWTVAGGKATVSNLTRENIYSIADTLTVGNMYYFEYTITDYVDGSVKVLCGTNNSTPNSANSNGVHTDIVECFTNGTYGFRSNNGTSNHFSISSFSIKDLGPVLRLTDGTNDTSLPITVGKHDFEAHYKRVLGDELIANGDFSNGTTGWSAYSNGSVIDAIGEQLNCETTFEDRGFYQQIPGLIRDKEYIMRVDVLTVTTDNLRISLGSGIGNLTSGFIDITTPGHYEYTFTTIGSGDLYLSFSHGTTGNTSVDNVTFREESVAESNMQLKLDDDVSPAVHYDGTMGPTGSGDITIDETGRDFKRLDTSEIV